MGPVELRPQKPTSTGFENNLWSLPRPENGDREPIERDFFGPLDGRAAGLLARFSRREVDLSADDLGVWAMFVASLHLRVAERVKRLRKEGPSQLLSLLSAPDPDFDAWKGDHPAVTPAEFAQLHMPEKIENAGVRLLPLILTEGASVKTIAGMTWQLRWLPAAEHTLLISDMPMMLLAPVQAPNCLIALPLTPRMIFFAAADPQILERLRVASDGEIVRMANETTVENAKSFVVGECSLRFLVNRWRGGHAKH